MANTVTAFNTFVAGTRAKADEVNTNFNNFRGDMIPINTNTITASDNSHDLGTSDHRWKDIYLSGSIITASGQTSGVIPVGTVINCAFSTTPSGYLPCDGSSVSRTTYAALFRWMTDGTNTLPCFGYETATNFNVPDLRGYFVRGVDGGAGNDPDATTTSRTAQGTNASTGDSVGSVQSYALENMTGSIVTGLYSAYVSSATGVFGFGSVGGSRYGSGATGSNTRLDFNASGSATTSTETRPKNIYLKYFIKH